ncbi:flagellar hook-associated family protein [Rhizobium oryzicola]|uniref:Flagellin n=1 Tax=Rhizobium oryzicola TaxID=1232668 RepID=A0ABT8SRI5_9HYPH|nr:flagellar hook-associated family protein [Rhizobium oryzicola]MDO1581035.1 flagellar hook-associated family protein [Rhizobium oryzicola]
MKTSFNSSLSVQSSLLAAMSKAQKDLVQANKEVTTGVHADMGVALAEKTARSLDLSRDVLRIETQKTSNSVATNRLDNSDKALADMSSAAQQVQAALTSLTGSTQTLGSLQQSINNAINLFTDRANTAVGGEYLFAGTNTDIKPMASYTEAGSTFSQAVDDELNQYLSSNGIASASAMTPAQMSSFLSDLKDKFDGKTMLTDPPHAGMAGKDFWSTYVSNASDTNMTSRISSTEVVQTSTNANDPAFRNFMFGSVIATKFLTEAIPSDVRSVVAASATNAIGRANNPGSGIIALRSALGLSAERVKVANDSLDAQKKIIDTHLNDLQGVDAYEASTRVSSLKALLEAAYTLTSRIQQLSLVNYLR